MDRIWDGFDLKGESFDFSCEAFLLLQALVTLGFGEEPDMQRVFAMLPDNRLPDGGFLCKRRRNKMEAVSALGYGNAPEAAAGWQYLESAKDDMGRVILAGTMTKSYLLREKVGKPSAWATFYALLADKER